MMRNEKSGMRNEELKSASVHLVALALILILLALALSGCHGSQSRSAFEVPAEFDTSRTFDITFWAKNDTNQVQAAI